MVKKKINVKLQYPWKFPDSSYYKNILDYPPKGVNFVNYSAAKTKNVKVIGSSKKFLATKKIKNVFRKILGVIRLPNVTLNFSSDFDLIHCAHCLVFTRKPWVVDSEIYNRLASADGNVAGKGIGKWIIKKNLESKNCKKIIAWSDDCKKTFEEAFPENKKILDKLILLPFALPKPKYKQKKHDKINILFVARWFYEKGGKQTLEVFDRLSKEHKNVNFIFIAPTPKELKDKYKKNKSIQFFELMPQEKLIKDYYTKTDIFFYPGFCDSYGFAVPEVLTYGIPVVSTKNFAKSELIQDKKTGFLVDMPKKWDGYRDMNETFLKNLYEKTEILIKDEKLRKKMSKEAKKFGLNKFSIEKRNKQLRKIYEEAIK